MSTPILGPLSNGTRLQFAMEYDLPQSVDESYGNIIITDSLPAGLSWYSTINPDHKNKVMIGQIQKIANITFTAVGNKVILTIPNFILTIPANQGKKLYVEIDAVISNESLIQTNTVLTNHASLNFTRINLSGSGSTDFMLTPLDPVTINAVYEKSASPYSGTKLRIGIIFLASSNTGVFNYDIMCDFGENLVFNPKAPEAYVIINSSANQISPVTVTKDQFNSNVYHFIFANTTKTVDKLIALTVAPETRYDEIIGFRSFTVVPEYIEFKYSIQIGGAQSEIKPISIPVANKIDLRKSVVGETPLPPEPPQPIILTKTVVTK